MSDELLKGGIFVSGPQASVIVYDKEHVEPVITALCGATGDDPDDYTATDLDNPEIASGEELEAIQIAIDESLHQWTLNELLAVQSPTGQEPFIWTEEMKDKLMNAFKEMDAYEKQMEERDKAPKCYVHFDSSHYVSREPNEDDSWDTGDDGYENTLIGIMSEPSHEFIPLCFNLVEGEEYYLVWAEYSTGDSFGSFEGCIEVVDLFKTETKANDCVDAIQNSKGDKMSYSFIRENGIKCKQHCPWNGYFEYLQTVHLDKVIWGG